MRIALIISPPQSTSLENRGLHPEGDYLVGWTVQLTGTLAPCIEVERD